MDVRLIELLERLNLSFDEVRERLQAAVAKAWVRDVYADWFVYQEDQAESGGRTYRRAYAIDPETGAVTLGEAVEVIGQMVWTPVAAASDAQASEGAATSVLAGDVVPLLEARVREDGTIPVRIIAPGWGSSGYYPAEMLERDGPQVFKAGLHTYWNHPSATEERERPERDLRDLAGTLAEDAHWDANGPVGPGLYGRVAVASRYQEDVGELAPHIGVSIRALGRVAEGEADGRKGKVVQELVAARSVDFVTTPGAGGRVLELFEAAGGRAPAERTDAVTEQEAQELRAQNERLVQENAALKARLVLRQAQDVATEVAGAVELPEAARKRVVAAQSAAPMLAEDGSLNEVAYRERVQEAAEAERAYLTEALATTPGTARDTGKITGMGAGASAGDVARTALKEAFVRAGLSPEQAETAANGRG